MRGKTILIVDDEAVWRKLLARLFGGCGYAVMQAASCDAGLRALRTGRFDCAIVDFNLGDGTGDVICAALRERDGGMKTPVIMLTGDPEAANFMGGPHRADMLVFKSRPVIELPSLMASLF
jgi:DNA-binding response OmpR family regulator